MPKRLNKLLIVAPSWVGDAVISQVLLKLIKAQNKDTIIHVLAIPSLHSLFKFMPEVDGLIDSPFKHGKLNLKLRYKLGLKLKKRGYTQVVVLPNSLKSALLPFFSSIKKRTGWVGEFRYGLLNDIRILSKNKYPLMLQRFAALAFPKNCILPKNLPNPKLVVNRKTVDDLLASLNIVVKKPILALCPGAEYGPAKRWPAKYFAEIAKYQASKGWEVWLFGNNKEKTIANEIQNLTNSLCVDFIGKTKLDEAILLMSCATVVVTNDSGLMHVAAALNIPLIVIYGSTTPKFTPPLSKNSKILYSDVSCRPCFKRKCPYRHLKCLKEVKPSLVFEILDKFIL